MDERNRIETMAPTHGFDRRAWLGLALVVAVLGTGCLSAYEKGTKYYQAGEYTNAQNEAQEGLSEKPKDPELNLLMAKSLAAQEEYRKAESYAKRAFDAEGTRGEGGRILGKIHWELGRALKAVEVWRVSREEDPELVPKEDYRRALIAAIGTADSSHKYKRALELREELETIAPNHPEVDPQVVQKTRRKRAEDLVQRGEYEEAAGAYETLAKNADGDGTYAYERGRLLLRLKRPDEAAEAFDRYIESASAGDRLERTLDVARRAKDLNAPRVASTYYRRAIESLSGEPTFRRAKLRLTLAKLLFETKDGKGAREQIRSYLEDMRQLRGVPLDPEVYRTAADSASESGRNGFAIELLETALEKAPPSWSIASRLAQQYAVQARQSEARRVLDTYIKRSDETAEALLHSAEWAKQRRNYDLAKTFYERLVNEDPDRSEAWLALGKLYAKLGQIENMKDALDTFVEKHGSDRHDLLAVASVYSDQQLYRDAERVLEIVRERKPKSLLVVDRLAELYRTWGKPVRIQKVYKKWIRARGGSPSDYQLVGERLIRRQKYRQALPFFEKAAEKGVTEAWLQIADIYKRQRRELDMKRALETYVDKASSRTRALRSAFDRYRGTSLTREKTEILEELIEREPGVRSHYERLGETYLAQGRRQEAFTLWQQYVEQAADKIQALRTVAGWFEQAGRSGLTLEFYRRWTRGEDPDPRLYRLMGDAYMKLAPARWTRRRPSVDLIEEAQEQAKRYYRRYLREADPSSTELTDFANSMRESNMWSTAARAYREIVGSVAKGSELRLHYGESMLHLGRIDRAMQAFETYYGARGEGPDEAQKIAQHLVRFRYLDRAEPYLDRMFESEKGDLVQEAFVDLTRVYQHTGRSERISDLVSEYLNRAPNPAKARQTTVSVLERRGLYAEAAEQIERIREFQGNVLGFRHGANLFRAGKFDDAESAFRRHASENPYAASVWLKIASFYEKHARPKRALESYSRAVRAAPDDSKPREKRGRFRILRGAFEKGAADFRDALDRANTKRRDDIRKTWIDVLLDVGDYARAAELARTSLKSASKHRDFFLRVLAVHELKTGDESHVNRMVQRLSSSSLPVQNTVRLLVEHGHRTAAADLIERQLESGDFTSAGQAIVQRPDVFTRLGGLDALKRAARPLLKQNNSQSTVRAQLGEYFIRQGRYEDGIAYLQSSMKDGRPRFQPVLAHAYAASGRLDRASAIFQRYLRRLPERHRGEALAKVGARYELAGHPERFDALLENLATDPAFGGPATGLLVQQRAVSGNVDDALGRIEEQIDDLSTGGTERIEFSLDRPDAAERVLSAIEGLAAAGFREEAAALLDQLPESVRSRPDFREFDVHLAAAMDVDNLEERVERALESEGSALGNSRTDRRLSFARVLNIDGHYELAARTARPLLEGTDYHSFQRGTLFLIRNAYLSRDRTEIENRTRQLLESVSDELIARKQVGQELRRLGLDERATTHLREVSRRAPTADNVRQALSAAAAAGDAETLNEMIDRFSRIVDEPLQELRGRWQMGVDRQDAALTEAFLAPYQKTYPARLRSRLGRTRLAFREGDVEKGRELLVAYLERVEFEPRAVERVLRFLHRNGLPYESAVVIGGRLGDVSLTEQSHRYLGYAHLALEHRSKGRAALKRAIDGAPDPAQAATEVAERLVAREEYALAEKMGARAVELAPDRPAGHLFRGLARLSLGKTESAKADLKIGLGSTMERIRALSQAGRAALTGGSEELAAKYLEQLARTPNSEQTGLLLPFRTALDAYVEGGRPGAGVEFIESRFPRIAAGDGLGSTQVRSQLSGLYEKAGMPDRAFEIYRAGIAREEVRAPDGGALPVYLNNLAYVYSTTNRNVDRGFDLARRAITGALRRQPSYLDTLGWLHYRRGEYARAEEFVRRALRTASGTPSELVELYEHLSILREARGFTEDAFWLRRFYRSLERR